MTILLNNDLYTEKPIILMKGEQPQIEEPAKCYLCDGDDAVGECIITKIEEYPKSLGRKFIRETLQMDVKEYGAFRGDQTVYGWTVEDATMYDEPKSLKAWGITREPETWAYADGNAPEPEPVQEPAEFEQEGEVQGQGDYSPEYEPEQQEGPVEPSQGGYQGRNRKRNRGNRS